MSNTPTIKPADITEPGQYEMHINCGTETPFKLEFAVDRIGGELMSIFEFSSPALVSDMRTDCSIRRVQ